MCNYDHPLKHAEIRLISRLTLSQLLGIVKEYHTRDMCSQSLKQVERKYHG